MFRHVVVAAIGSERETGDGRHANADPPIILSVNIEFPRRRVLINRFALASWANTSDGVPISDASTFGIRYVPGLISVRRTSTRRGARFVGTNVTSTVGRSVGSAWTYVDNGNDDGRDAARRSILDRVHKPQQQHTGEHKRLMPARIVFDSSLTCVYVCMLSTCAHV